MTGWIRVNRRVFEHQFFQREPMSEREAWLWMIARAAWENTTHRVGGEVHEVPRGSFMATLRELQSTFMWRSDSRVRGFLSRLESERMIERTTRGPKNAPKTHVTICNYDEFQSHERTENAPKTHGERTEERTKETNINNKQSKDGDFDRFWSAVPRKVNKGAARKAWKSAIKKSDPETIIAGMERYAKERDGKDQQYTAHPASWLNGERWADEAKPMARHPQGIDPITASWLGI